MRYLLDTNILSAMIRMPHGEVAARVEKMGEKKIFTSIVVASEMRFGAARKGSAVLTLKIEGLLDTMEIAPLEIPADRFYASIRTHLENAGTPIGNNDMLIAAHALATDSVVVTDNIKEFSRVPGLKIENWLR
jgi:tRNA(fMet)-specific endonuclease VapC